MVEKPAWLWLATLASCNKELFHFKKGLIVMHTGQMKTSVEIFCTVLAKIAVPCCEHLNIYLTEKCDHVVPRWQLGTPHPQHVHVSCGLTAAET